ERDAVHLLAYGQKAALWSLAVVAALEGVHNFLGTGRIDGEHRAAAVAAATRPAAVQRFAVIRVADLDQRAGRFARIVAALEIVEHVFEAIQRHLVDDAASGAATARAAAERGAVEALLVVERRASRKDAVGAAALEHVKL